MDNGTVSSWGPSGAKWAAAVVVSLWTSIPAMIQTLVLLMAIDYATGWLRAAAQKKVTSAAGLLGLMKKAATLMVVVAVHRVMQPMHLPIDFGATLAAAFVWNELVSIVENASDLGVPIPPALVELLLRTKKMTGRGVSPAKVREELEEPVGKSS